MTPTLSLPEARGAVLRRLRGQGWTRLPVLAAWALETHDLGDAALGAVLRTLGDRVERRFRVPGQGWVRVAEYRIARRGT